MPPPPAVCSLPPLPKWFTVIPHLGWLQNNAVLRRDVVSEPGTTGVDCHAMTLNDQVMVVDFDQAEVAHGHSIVLI